jgi:phosphoglycerate dehydrogenase-like enzyme
VNVYYPAPANDSIVAQLNDLVFDGIVVSSNLEDVPDFEVLVEGRPTRDLLLRSEHLKTVVVPFAGVPDVTLNLVRQFQPLQLCNLHHNSADTAELAIGLLLACSRSIVPLDQKLRKGDWSPRYLPSNSVLLAGKTALIIGYGHIGKHIARACNGLGMNVLALRRRTQMIEIAHYAEVHPIAGLRPLLPEADVIFVAVPRTSETLGLINEGEFDLMKPNAILVNIARADIVDEKSLFEALQSGRLHSAGLDVWYQYPTDTGDKGVPGYFDMPESALHTFPSAFPFHELENVVMSPHRGGASKDTESSRIQHLAALLNSISGGEDIPNLVDLASGY